MSIFKMDPAKKVNNNGATVVNGGNIDPRNPISQSLNVSTLGVNKQQFGSTMVEQVGGDDGKSQPYGLTQALSGGNFAYQPEVFGERSVLARGIGPAGNKINGTPNVFLNRTASEYQNVPRFKKNTKEGSKIVDGDQWLMPPNHFTKRDGVEVATTHRARANNVATLTVASHTFEVGDYVEVRGLGGVGYNGFFTVSAKTGTTISFTSLGPNETIEADAGGFIYGTQSQQINPGFQPNPDRGTRYDFEDGKGGTGADKAVSANRSVPGEITFRFGAAKPKTSNLKPRDQSEGEGP